MEGEREKEEGGEIQRSGKGMILIRQGISSSFMVLQQKENPTEF